jgi:hypothetical protein
MKRSKIKIVQKDDWSCGYLAILSMIKILDFGVEKWIKY